MQKNGWIIVATDTDAGKTFVTAGLFRQFLRNGTDCLAVKPVQTGCEIDSQGHIDAPDVSIYVAAAGSLLPKNAQQDMLCYAYRTPCSPALAGELAGHQPDLEVIGSHVAALKDKLLLIETAGGIFTPINKRATMLDLVKMLKLPALVVADNRLGAINQVLMTTAVLRQHAVDVQGVILTHRSPLPENDIIREDNVRTITDLGHIDILADIPFLQNFKAEDSDSWSETDPYFAKIASILHPEQSFQP